MSTVVKALGALLVAGVTLAAPAPASAASGVTFQVNSTADQVDRLPGDGVCKTKAGTCSIRAAFMEANLRPLTHTTVVIPEGRFVMTLRRAVPLVNATPSLNGPFNALSNMTIRGAGQSKTILDGNQLDRILTVASPLARVEVSDLTLTNGVATSRELVAVTGGGAIANQGTLVLRHVTVDGNRADYGGGVFNTPSARAEVYDSSISSNTANVEGGGVRFDASGLVVNSTISGNRVLSSCRIPLTTFDGSLRCEGGGVDTRGAGKVQILSSKIVDNHAVTGGGGINAATGYQGDPAGLLGKLGIKGFQVEIRDSVVTGNTSDAGPRNCKSTISPIRSLGGNVDDDGSCGF